MSFTASILKDLFKNLWDSMSYIPTVFNKYWVKLLY